MNTLVEDVRDDSSEDDDEDDDNASEMVSEIGKSAHHQIKNTILEDQQEVKRRNKDCQNKKNLKSAWKNLQNPKRNQTKNFWKK